MQDFVGMRHQNSAVILHLGTVWQVFPDDETVVFNCSLALLLRHSLVDACLDGLYFDATRLDKVSVHSCETREDLYRPKFPKLGVTCQIAHCRF